MKKLNHLPEYFPVEKIEGEWNVFITRENRYADVLLFSEKHLPCQCKDDAMVLAKSLKVLHDTFSPPCRTPALADSLDEIAVVAKRCQMNEFARDCRYQSERIRIETLGDTDNLS